MGKHSYRAFIGISGKSYTITIENNGDYFVIPSKTTDSSNKYEMSLSALQDLLALIGAIVKTDIKLCFYCDDFDLNYDWEMIQKNGNKLTSCVESFEKWSKIMNYIQKHRIELKISNKSFLEPIGKVGRR